MTTTRVYIKGARYYYVADLPERHRVTGRPKQRWHKLTLVSEGEAAMHAALASLLATPEPASAMREAIDKFLAAKLPELTPGVRKEYERMYAVIGQAFAEFEPADVVPGDIEEFLSANFEGKPTAKRHYKARLSTFFSWCVRARLAVANPCREIRVKGPPKRRGRMSAEIFWRLRERLPPMGQCFMDLCFLTAQRPTEIRLLKRSAIQNDVIHFLPSKTEDSTGEDVWFALTPEIQEVLDRAGALAKVRAVGRGDAYVIQQSGGSPYTTSGLHSMWDRACRALGIKGVSTRDIRPFALRELEKAGYSLDDIRITAAHTTSAMTEHYLNQHRERHSTVRLQLPKKSGKT